VSRSGGSVYQAVSGATIGVCESGSRDAGEGDGGLEGFVGERREGPLSRASASRIMECRRWSWEDMKGAECRSPVQRVMSTQSRDSFRRLRSWERAGRMSGWSGERWRCVWGWVLRRRWSDCSETRNDQHLS
jgi:hypothetical protein